MTNWTTTTNLGPYPLNTVIPGDCLEVLPGLPESCVDLVVGSPPFNVGMDYGDTCNDWRPWAEETKDMCWHSPRLTTLRVAGAGVLKVLESFSSSPNLPGMAGGTSS